MAKKHLVYPSKKFVDKAGERVWFPEDNKPYFDKAARRVFHNVEEKANFLNSRGFVNTGDSESKVKKERKQYEIMQKDLKCRMV